MNKALARTTEGSTDATEQPLLNQKTELATRAVDMLLFGGATGKTIKTMASMAGMPDPSIGMIFPTEKPANMRPFLGSLNSIISTALDDRVELPEFTGQLAEAIREIQRIAEEERA